MTFEFDDPPKIAGCQTKYSEVDREFIVCQDEGEVYNIGYILGAEPREKQIQIDAEQSNSGRWKNEQKAKGGKGLQ